MTRAEFLRRDIQMHIKEASTRLRVSPKDILAFERREPELDARQLQVYAAILGAHCAGERLLDEVDALGRTIGIYYSGTGLHMLPTEELPDLDGDVDLDDVGDDEPTPAGSRLSDTK